jgi:uncharacterized protein YuzE
MKLTYDQKHNIAYLRLHEKRGEVTTLRISDAMNVDIASDGTVYGIELLNANEQLNQDGGALILETDGNARRIPLPV